MVTPYWNNNNFPSVGGGVDFHKKGKSKYDPFDVLEKMKSAKSGGTADFYSEFFKQFDPAFFENIKKALAYMPYGYDRSTEATMSRKLLSETDKSIRKLSAIARAQGFGENSGVAAGGARDLNEQYVDKMTDIGAQLQFMSQNRPLMQAMFIKSLLDPENTANQLLQEAGIHNFSMAGDAGLWGVLGQALSGVNWEKLFKK